MNNKTFEGHKEEKMSLDPGKGDKKGKKKEEGGLNERRVRSNR